MIKLSDYLFQRLADYGVQQIFLVTGGGAMHLNESVRKERRLRYLCNHHEQACAMAAEGYARVTGKIGVLNVTTGPGGINALNGVFGAWTDSIPLLIVSGQVKRETCSFLYPPPLLRQLGDQEADIIRMAKGITKYAVCVEDPATIRYHLEKALFLATSGRPGPCWLDIPMDIQAALLEEEALVGYDPREDDIAWDPAEVRIRAREILFRLAQSRRPVIMAGSGVRLAGAVPVFETLIHRLGLPVTTAWTAIDLLASDHPLFCGRPGTIGDRAGNFTVQNADTLLVLGSRLNVRQVSYNWASFARHAYKIQVDIDPVELEKPTVKPDLGIPCDLKVFLEAMLEQLGQEDGPVGDHSDWLAWCRERVARYPVVLPRHRTPGRFINPYHFMERLSHLLKEDDVVVCGNGSACVVTFQAAWVKRGQRLFANSGCASMGYDLPAAVGAAMAGQGKRVICLAGDGSIQMNIQELQTVAHYGLPLVIFVFNNRGYLSIRSTQQAFFGEFIGEGPESGVSFPDIVKVAQAYGIMALRLEPPDWERQLDAVLASDGAVVCDVMLDPQQQFEPKLSSRQLPDGRIISAALEDLYPFLPQPELQQNMLVPLAEEPS